MKYLMKKDNIENYEKTLSLYIMKTFMKAVSMSRISIQWLPSFDSIWYVRMDAIGCLNVEAILSFVPIGYRCWLWLWTTLDICLVVEVQEEYKYGQGVVEGDSVERPWVGAVCGNEFVVASVGDDQHKLDLGKKDWKKAWAAGQEYSFVICHPKIPSYSA